jgi:hypothetical protein
MSGKWVILVLFLAVATTLLNIAIFVGQISTAATARSGIDAGKLLDDDDFADGLTKVIRKTVRDYCTVGKRNGIDC